MVLFISFLDLIFESVDEILRRYHSGIEINLLITFTWYNLRINLGFWETAHLALP